MTIKMCYCMLLSGYPVSEEVPVHIRRTSVSTGPQSELTTAAHVYSCAGWCNMSKCYIALIYARIIDTKGNVTGEYRAKYRAAACMCNRHILNHVIQRRMFGRETMLVHVSALASWMLHSKATAELLFAANITPTYMVGCTILDHQQHSRP